MNRRFLWRRGGVLTVATAYRYVMGAALVAPLAVVVARTTGNHPRSDAVLWDGGGQWLAAVGADAGRWVPFSLSAGAVGLIAAAFGWLLVLALLIAHLADASLGPRALLRRALDRFAPLTVLYGITAVGQVLAMGGAFWLSTYFRGATPRADLTRAGCMLGGLAVAGLMGIGHDAARTVSVVERPDALTLITRTFGLLGRGGAATLFAAGWRGALAWLALWLGVVNSARFVGKGIGMDAVAVALQLLAIGTYVGLRASWFGWLIRRLPKRKRVVAVV